MLFRFLKFPVYKLAKEFRKEIKDFFKKKLPTEEKFLLLDQAFRALNSICLNIAEGSNRASDKDFARFLNEALTSLEEVICCLDLAMDDNYITETEFKEKLLKAEKLGKQLIAFQKRLRSNS